MKCRVCGEQITHESEVKRLQVLVNAKTGKRYEYNRTLSTCRECLRRLNRESKARARAKRDDN